jgi:chorismate dehydratase
MRGPLDGLNLLAVPYLNVEPLLDGLHPVRREYPSKMLELLRSGACDLATLPIGAVLGNSDLVALPSSGISCVGPVRTVLLQHTQPLSQIDNFCPDRASRTSNLLAAWLLRERTQRIPQVNWESAHRVVIGDPAFALDPNTVTDLGQEWVSHTGLPFVFAVWVAGPSLAKDPVRLHEMDHYLAQIRDRGLGNVVELARDQTVVDPGLAYKYLTKNICYTLTDAHRQGADRFAMEAVSLTESVYGEALPSGAIPWLY